MTGYGKYGLYIFRCFSCNIFEVEKIISLNDCDDEDYVWPTEFSVVLETGCHIPSDCIIKILNYEEDIS